MLYRSILPFALGLRFAASLAAAPGEAPDAAGLEFFEKNIRPIFVDHCYACHSAGAEKLKGGLLLDSRAGWLKGGDTGPAIVPGDPEKSLLISAVRYTDENLQMPPKKKKLAPGQIAALEAWVKLGAPDPRTAPTTAGVSPAAAATNHWAFQPVRTPPVPRVKNQRWPQTDVDAFILAKLEEKGLTPSARADRRTLIRRVTFDLLGLPPTPEEVAAFVADRSPDAYARLLDRLLASPHYGERWARHWLDVARYADSKGYVFEEERRYPYAYTYRDYVIRAFNEDLPYDRFITEQLAADLLPLGDDKRPLAALGYLTLGRRFLNNPPDIIDDRIDVVSRGLMGLTVGCARCHDHKFDPIPTKDYYSLYGVFASCNEPAEKPLLGTASLPADFPAYTAEKKKRDDEVHRYRAERVTETRARLRQQAVEYLRAATQARLESDAGKREALARERKLDPGVMNRWLAALESWTKTPSPIFAPWLAFAVLPENDFAASARPLTDGFAAHSPLALHPLVGRAFATPPATLAEVAERYIKLFADTDTAWQAWLKEKPDATSLPDADQESLRQILYAADAPPQLPDGELTRLFDTPAQQKLRALQRQVDELDATHPGAPPRAMALLDNPTPEKPHVFVRGNPGNLGPEVPRQFPAIVAGVNRAPFQHGSGRLELAQAIARRDNPLTARVFVNRVWLHHFGAALVRTPSDFGLRSDPPSHPELLDYLAARFMDEGWSVKKLHRLILLSSVYQQSSADDPRAAQIDPANQWLWKMNRHRLDFEATRDSLLAVSGRLDFTAGGQPVDIVALPGSPRRTVYGFVERQNMPGLFRTFDFASPDATSPGRFSTTVPQQALFLMNSPFLLDQVRHLVQRAEFQARATDTEKIHLLYQLAYQRAATPDEVKLARRFLATQAGAPPAAELPPLWQYGYGEFDEAAQRLKSFTPLPHFTGDAWQGGPKLPDQNLGWVTLSAKGGHAGNDQQHAAIRRWTAPRDGTVAVSGTLKHPAENGDGVRGRIVARGAEELGHWLVHHGEEAAAIESVAVRRGDTLDFIVDCNQNENSDSFTWTPVLKLLASDPGAMAGGATEWNAAQEFSGPKDKIKHLDPWEQYAQVLLLANELVFAD